MNIATDIQNRWDQLKKEWKPGLTEALGIRITHIDRGFVKAVMPVADNVKQPFGMLHGGASVCLAETLASLGSWMIIDTDRQKAVGLEINANHLQPVSGGILTAEATTLHQGRRTHVWQISIRNEHGQMACISRCTVAILDN